MRCPRGVKRTSTAVLRASSSRQVSPLRCLGCDYGRAEKFVKLRPFTRRLLGAAAVHSRMWRSGFLCPELLVAPTQFYPGSTWISAETLVRGGEAAQRARHRLSQGNEAPVVGHADWWSENLRWNAHQLHAVFDWDSITAQPEPIIAGAAAYVFAATTFEIEGSAPAADVSHRERFLVAYARARGRAWTREEWQTGWAASI